MRYTSLSDCIVSDTTIGDSVTVVMAPDGAIRAASASICAMLGYDPERLTGSFYHMIHDGDLLAVFRKIDELVMGYEQEAQVDLHLRSAGGEWKACHGLARLKLDHGVVASIILTLSPLVEALTT